ncbi:MAG: hypothetical protein ACTS5F_00575 [Candidatus Hodgkinia cicadicola]
MIRFHDAKGILSVRNVTFAYFPAELRELSNAKANVALGGQVSFRSYDASFNQMPSAS